MPLKITLRPKEQMIIDGAVQAVSKYEAHNWWRLVTGSLAGFALAGLVQQGARLVAGLIILLSSFL